MPRTHWISPEELTGERFVGPRGRPLPGELLGFTSSEGEIYLVKGRANEIIREHEKAHVRMGHHLKKVRDPREWIGNELDVEIFTNLKMGKPIQLKEVLRGYILDLEEDWSLSPGASFKLVKEEMLKRKNLVPRIWFKNLEALRAGYRLGEEPRIKEAYEKIS